jgi:hypothetical protein
MNDEVISDRAPRCPACNGAELSNGRIVIPGGLVPSLSAVMFKPAGNWLETHYVDAVACLTCGIVTLILRGDELENLRSASRKAE